MKIVAISDSHGNKSGVEKLFEQNKFDYLFFLGDGIKDLGDYIYLSNVYAVSGNCDFLSNYPNERIFTLNGIKFLITHGNKYSVKQTLNYLKEKAMQEEVDIVLFGHTHNKFIEKFNNILFINPGSFQMREKGIILDIDDNKNIKIDDFVLE